MNSSEVAPDHGLVVFAIDAHRYALRLAAVERVVRMVEITPLPSCPGTILGVINVHGHVVPVYDLRRRFRLPTREVELTDELILARTERHRVALAVDRVVQVLEGATTGPGAGTSGAATPSDLPHLQDLEDIVKSPEGLVLIPDLETFLSEDEEATLEQALSEWKPLDT